jgi:hypothetical protein
VIWLFCNSKNIILPRTTKTFSIQSGFVPPFTILVPGNLYRARLYFVCDDFGVAFDNASISYIFKMPVPHGLCSVLPTAALCSRDGDGCHFERTAGRWIWVRPGYPQVRDGSVLMWILCAAVSYIDILARHVESHRCPSNWHPVVYINTTLQPVSLWHQFTSSI